MCPLTVESDELLDANTDVCQLTPTQFTSFRPHDQIERPSEDDNDDDTDSESRRNTVTYTKQLSGETNESSLHEFQLKNNIIPSANDQASNIQLLKTELAQSLLARRDSTKSKSKDSKLSSGKSTISSVNSLYLACEVASLSSLTSDYSQFDFLSNNNASTSNGNNGNSLSSKAGVLAMPVEAKTQSVENTTASSKKASSNHGSNNNGGLTSFFFSNRYILACLLLLSRIFFFFKYNW